MSGSVPWRGLQLAPLALIFSACGGPKVERPPVPEYQPGQYSILIEHSPAVYGAAEVVRRDGDILIVNIFSDHFDARPTEKLTSPSYAVEEGAPVQPASEIRVSSDVFQAMAPQPMN